MIKWKRQLLGVRWPGSALVRLTNHPGMVECFAGTRPKRRRAAELQGVDASLNQSFLKFVGHLTTYENLCQINAAVCRNETADR
jgi:hypothetical protein